MRLANVAGRAVLAIDEGSGADVLAASGGAFGPDLPSIYARWDAFAAWAASASLKADVSFTPPELGAPSPEPRQVLAIGLNYADHVAESGFDKPDRLPPVFTKFVTSISGPDTTVTLPPGGNTDWEIELVAIIGRTASNVDRADAWSHVAGLTAGQDLSERASQLAGPAPQFGLAKSFAGFSPMGPWLVSVDEFTNPDDLQLGCSVNGERMQLGRTSDLLFPIPELIERLSRVVTLLPGDVIFSGTPSGVGMGRTPPRYLASGDVLTSSVEGIGDLRQVFV